MAHLSITGPNGEFTLHEIVQDCVTIGRYPDNTIVLENPSISGHHAEIERTGDVFQLKDLNSSNGTKINGQVVQVAALQNSDNISFGSVEGIFTISATELAKAPLQPNLLPHSTFGSKLIGLGASAYQGVRKRAELAALKAKIEKLKLIDLAHAHYMLGKRAYELKLSPSEYAAHYEKIAETEKSIAAKRVGVISANDATALQKIKDAALDSMMVATVQGLELKLKKQLADLGSAIDDVPGASELLGGTEELASTKERIAKLENEFAESHAEQERLPPVESQPSLIPEYPWARSVPPPAAKQGLMPKILLFASVGCGGIIGLAILVFLGGAISASKSGSSNHIVAQPQPRVESILSEQVQQALNNSKQAIFDSVHPVGTATSVTLHELSVTKWKNGTDTNRMDDVREFSVRYTLYWTGPLTTKGFTKITQTYDMESQRYTGGSILFTNGVTKSDLGSMAAQILGTALNFEAQKAGAEQATRDYYNNR